MPVIDIHGHLGAMPYPIKAYDPPAIEAVMTKFGIERCCVAHTLALTGDLVEGNQRLAEQISERPVLLGYVAVNPNFVELSLEEMRKYLTKPNFMGAKMHGSRHTQPLNGDGAQQIMKALLRYDRPLLVHLRGSHDLGPLRELADRFKTAQIIVAEMGGSDWQEVVRIAMQSVNLFLDCGGSRAYADRIRSAAEAIGAHRLLFGSGLPLTSPIFGLGMVRDSELSAVDKDKILSQNAKKLLNL